jgi:hypothetical protein
MRSFRHKSRDFTCAGFADVNDESISQSDDTKEICLRIATEQRQHRLPFPRAVESEPVGREQADDDDDDDDDDRNPWAGPPSTLTRDAGGSTCQSKPTQSTPPPPLDYAPLLCSAPSPTMGSRLPARHLALTGEGLPHRRPEPALLYTYNLPLTSPQLAHACAPPLLLRPVRSPPPASRSPHVTAKNGLGATSTPSPAVGAAPAAAPRTARPAASSTASTCARP